MRALVFVLFAVCCSAYADTLEQNPLDTAAPQRPTIEPPRQEPYAPPVDVRLELARLNPQYVLRESLDFDRIARDSELIAASEQQARLRNPFYGLELREPLEPAHISLFVLMNLLDVYTTMEGTTYPCVREANPLLPVQPSLEEVLLLKSLAGWLLLKEKETNPQIIKEVTFITSIAVVNNYDVIQRAMDTCPR